MSLHAQLVTFVGILTGVLLRTVVPFLVRVKKYPNKKIPFQTKFIPSAIAGFLLTVITAFILYNLIQYEMHFFEALGF